MSWLLVLFTGYDVGKPMISGMVTRNDSNNVFLYINSNSSRQMALWDTGMYNGLGLKLQQTDLIYIFIVPRLAKLSGGDMEMAGVCPDIL